jgi:methoxymalonate biosynthesis acyl carrier protein
MTDVKARLRAFVGSHVGSPQFPDDADIFRSGYVNSLFAMQLVMFIEKEFSLKVEGRDLKLANFQSIAAIAALIETKQKS